MSAEPHLRLVQRLVDEHTGEIQDCPYCATSRDEAETWEREVLKLKRRIRWLETDRDAKAHADKRYAEAESLFVEWQQECGHPNAEFDGDRIRLALAAVKRYPRDKLSYVVLYGKHLAYVDDRGVKHDRFGLLFKNSENIERYANAWYRCRNRFQRNT